MVKKRVKKQNLHVYYVKEVCYSICIVLSGKDSINDNNAI